MPLRATVPNVKHRKCQRGAFWNPMTDYRMGLPSVIPMRTPRLLPNWLVEKSPFKFENGHICQLIGSQKEIHFKQKCSVSFVERKFPWNTTTPGGNISVISAIGQCGNKDAKFGAVSIMSNINSDTSEIYVMMIASLILMSIAPQQSNVIN